MLATLNPKQIVDEIVKDTVKDNDPHDTIQISPDIVLASRPGSMAADVAPRPEPKFAPEPKISRELTHGREPRFSPVTEAQPTATPSVETDIRIPSEGRGAQKRSALGKWLQGAFVTFLFAGTSAAATIAWQQHGDTAKQILAEWTPALASLLPSKNTSVAAAQAAPPAELVDSTATQATVDQAADQPSAPAVQLAAAAPAATSSESAQSVQSLTRDLAGMAQQIEQLKASIAELKAGQEQMARELTKPPAARPVADARPTEPHPRAAALSPKPPAPPVRKPKPVVSRTYTPTYSPAPLAPLPPPSQAAAVPPPPVATSQAVADDDGPIVRPPLPLR